MKLIRPQPDDFFNCQMYLYDYDMWCSEVMRYEKYRSSVDYYFILSVHTKRIESVITYYESFGFHFEPPDFWETAGRMAHLVDSGSWVRLGEFSGYPANFDQTK